MAQRCAVEEKEFRTAVKPKQASEPVRACLLAPPGTGKTQTILWLLEFFDEVCLWENGVQYQTLASQNTMAAAICGNTNHSWGEVPINASGCNEASVKKNKDGISTSFLKCLSLRWLIPDEISTSGLIVLGILESNVRKACRQHLHAYNKQGEARAWGGLNLIISGDWLQLPPVSREYKGRVFGIPPCIICGEGIFPKYVPGTVSRGSHEEHDWERWGRRGYEMVVWPT